MDEEIDAPITIAIISGYTGTVKPMLRFTTGNNFDLGLEFQLNSDADVNQWLLVVNNKQDYEQPNMQTYIFSVSIDTESTTVQLTINNIFDNKPIVSLDFTSCSIPVSINKYQLVNYFTCQFYINIVIICFSLKELTDIDYDSKCTFVCFL